MLSERPMFRDKVKLYRSNITEIALFVLAAILTGRSSVQTNMKVLEDLPLFAAGQVAMPFQGRYLTVPLLRWAGHSHMLASLAQQMSKGIVITSQMLMLETINTVCVLLLAVIVTDLRKQFQPDPIFPWLPRWLCLWILNVIFVVRCESVPIKPYDFVAILFFSLALWAAVRANAVVFLLAVFVGSYNRDTLILLIPVWLTCNYKKLSPWQLLSVPALAAALGIAARLQVSRWVHATSTGLYFTFGLSARFLVNPIHWPHIVSAGGFLLIPLLLGRSVSTDPLLRAAWLGQSIFILATLCGGFLIETRIFGELTALTAVTAVIQIETWIRNWCAAQDFAPTPPILPSGPRPAVAGGSLLSPE